MIVSQSAAIDNDNEEETMVISFVIFSDSSVGKSVAVKVLDGSPQGTIEGKCVSPTDATNSCYSDISIKTTSTEFINLHQEPVEVTKFVVESCIYFGKLRLPLVELFYKFLVPAFGCIQYTVVDAIRITCELVGARVAFWDMNHWYLVCLEVVFDSAPILLQLDKVLEELCAMIDDNSLVFDPAVQLLFCLVESKAAGLLVMISCKMPVDELKTVLFMLQLNGVTCPKLECKQLTLELYMEKFNLYEAASLLQALPHVETLTINLMETTVPESPRCCFETLYLAKGDNIDCRVGFQTLHFST